MADKLQQVLLLEIPLTRAIGIQVVTCDACGLKLSAPLENNINHKATAFGGSLYSVAVLSGWGLVYALLEMHDLPGQIVIQQSSTQFIRPVTTDIVASCSFESDEQSVRFISRYKRKGLARIHLKSQVLCGGQVSVQFEGDYVVHSRVSASSAAHNVRAS